MTLSTQENITRFIYVYLSLDFLPLILGPALLFYIVHTFLGNRIYLGRFVWHIIPAVLVTALHISYIASNDLKEIHADVIRVFSGENVWHLQVVALLKIASGFAYMSAIIFFIYKNRNGIKSWLKKEHSKYWLTILSGSFAICWVVVFVSWSLQISYEYSQTIMLIAALSKTAAFVTFFYAITLFSLYNPQILQPRIVREEIKRKLQLSETTILEIKHQLFVLANEKYFRNESLSLRILSQKLNVHSNVLSFIINDEFEMNFNEYLNKHRLNDFISSLEEVRNGSTTFLSLAYKVGFNSKSTFNRVFRATYAQNPSEYLKKESQISY